MRYISTLAASLALAAAFSACSSSQPAAATVTADAACQAVAAASCAKIDACTLGQGNKVRYGDAATCIARSKADCLASLAAAGTARTPAKAKACADVLPTETCADWQLGNPPAACLLTGSLAAGQACSFSGQCATGWCGGLKAAVVGTCAPLPKPGDSCTNSACGPGLRCATNAAGAEVCETPVAVGGTCDKDHHCGPGLGCVGYSSKTPAGTCKATGNTVGAACDPTHQTAADCDSSLYLFCASDKTCHAKALVAAAQPCGDTAADAKAVCSSGECVVKLAGDSSGTCAADAADGAACDTDITKGPGCMAPARCVPTSATTTAGVCKRLGG